MFILLHVSVHMTDDIDELIRSEGDHETNLALLHWDSADLSRCSTLWRYLSAVNNDTAELIVIKSNNYVTTAE